MKVRNAHEHREGGTVNDTDRDRFRNLWGLTRAKSACRPEGASAEGIPGGDREVACQVVISVAGHFRRNRFFSRAASDVPKELAYRS